MSLLDSDMLWSQINLLYSWGEWLVAGWFGMDGGELWALRILEVVACSLEFMEFHWHPPKTDGEELPSLLVDGAKIAVSYEPRWLLGVAFLSWGLPG